MHFTKRAAAVMFAAALLACDRGPDTIMSADPSYDLLLLDTDFLPGVPVLDPFAHGDDHGVTESARGGGHINLAGELRTFAFNAKNYPDGTTNGQFQLHSRLGDSKEHGTVTCLHVEGTTAYIGGIITHSNQGTTGFTRIWRVMDNGEGSGSPPDQITIAFGSGLPPGDQLCRTTPAAFRDVEFGNIQVTDAQ